MLGETKNTFGAVEDGWTASFNRRAKVTPLSGSEIDASDSESHVGKFEILMRYDSLTAAISESDRAKVGADIYRIKHVRNVEMRNRDIVLECEKWS